MEKKIVIIKESVTKSLIKDVGTFILFAGLLYFNHQYLAGHVLIDLVFIAIVILWLTGRKSPRVFEGTKEEAIKWLKEQ